MSDKNKTRDIGFSDSEKNQKDVYRKGKNYLLAIGIDQYQHCPTLYNAAKDAKEVVALLQDRYEFLPEHTLVLYDKDATKRSIYKKIRYLQTNVTANDNVIIYFSGHGEFDKIDNEGFWIPVEAENGATDDYIPNSVIRKKLSTIKAHHLFLMADSCFSGSLFAKGTGRNVSKRYEKDPSRWGLTSGRNEIVSDGKPGDNSPFADSLLYRLRSNIGSLSVQELCAHVLEQVDTNANQIPIGEPLQIAGHKNGQFVFHLKKDEAADWKETQTLGTLVAFQSFIAKYPDGKNALSANEKIAKLKAAQEWIKIEQLPEEKITEINRKSNAILRYTKQYSTASNKNAAIEIGADLHDKADLLKCEDNIFRLQIFANKDTAYQKAALEKIKALEQTQELKDATVAEEERKRQERERREREQEEAQRQKEQAAAQKREEAEAQR